MNLFIKELRDGLKPLFWWSVGTAFLILSGMAKFAAYKESGQSLNELMSHMPRALQALVGFSSFDLSQAIGYFGVLYLYLVLLVTVRAVLLGVDVLTKESLDRTAEFLFAKPVSREAVITAKLAAAILTSLVFTGIVWGMSLAGVGHYAEGQPIGDRIRVLMEGLLMLQMVFLALGAGLAGVIVKAKAASTAATSFLLAAFVLSVAININEKWDALRYLTPFKYFEASDLYANGLDPVYTALALLITAAGIAAAYLGYRTRDL